MGETVKNTQTSMGNVTVRT